EFLRNEKLDARNFFAGAIKPSYKQNQFGGSVGGPIRKDRTFFFGDYERFRQRQGQTFASTVPTLAMRQGNFSGVNAVFDPFSAVPGSSVRTRFAGDQIPVSRQDPVGLQLLNLYPLPQTTGLVNNFTLNPTRSQNNDTFDVRVDHRLSEKDTLFARYSFNNTDTFLPGAFPTTASGIDPVGDTGRSGTAKQRAHGAQINNVHIFGPHLVMEAKAGFTRYSVQSLPLNYGKNVDDQLGIKGANFDADSSGLSIINVAGFRPLGDASYIPLLTVNNTFQELVNFTYLQGSHSIKVGADLRRRQVSAFQSPFSKGQFSFDANLTNDPSGLIAGSGNSAASLLLGYPAATTRSKYLVYPGLRLWETAAYIQDDWRATRWLTLNMGVRYDYFGPVTEVANRLSNIDLATGKIIIAGQNGVSPSAGVQADKVNFAPRFGFAATLAKGTVLRGGYGISFVPNMIASSMALRNPPFVSLYTVTATPLTPLNRISDGLPLPVPTSAANPAGDLNGVAPVGSTPYVHQYNLTLQRELPWGLVATVSYAAALGHKQYIFNGAINLNQPAPAPGAIQPRRPYYSVLPNVSAINIAAPWYNTNYQSLQSTLEHRYKSGLSILATYTYAHSIDDQVQMVNDRKVERGNSFLDVRSRFTLLANYRLPFARKAQGFGGLLARNWTVNAVTVLTTGIPFNITNAAPRANTGGNDRPNLIGDPNLPDSQQSVYQWFNTGAFAAQPLYTFGNLARNALHSPGRKSLDLSIYREFIPTERFRVQFRAESFNLTNTPAFSAPGATLGSATFGVISSAGLPRNLQFGLKLLF
ncbi:MAG TPA: TonB-dependent receptor, partial [Bryobacteraceae bacterium]|nr:TonB-dependent receptor [Bryobacteraceae bacterium]